ncbi:immunoglobulin superfamily member 11 isoform X1 [Syngnathoides biaculeatus]|uniref:immunoglobulin superfamily member 11 isoform X1 n=1 Tax=Syngnathoides biaculeatus TaxID=300417 RepID=UPI002ADE945B|nr:immunoglobulin superfamily member 11 isoform X1 [Syngnathoides biaculeatus]
MVATGRRALWSLCVCFAALHTNALRVTMRVSTVEVVRGDFVILPCSFYTSSPLSRLNIIWTLAPLSSPESPIQVIVYDHGQIIEDPSLIGRVGFTGIPWSADIMVNDTRVSDAGIYRCMVNNPPEMADPGIGELLLTVLVAPSLPACQWEGDMDAGGSVTLSCSVAEGIPTPEIHWDKIKPEEISLPINMDGELSGSVQIANVSSQTSGLYRCSASNLLGTENCYINLSIHSEVGESSSGILQGVLLTLAMSLMLLSLLVLVIWLHQTGQDGRRRVSKMEEEEEEGYNEIQYTPSLMKRSFV